MRPGCRIAARPRAAIRAGRDAHCGGLRGGGAWLNISARLPELGQDGYAPQGRNARFDGLDCMWHADEGCHIAVRRIALARLGDERSVMDAILETADMAQAWHASLTLDQPPAC